MPLHAAPLPLHKVISPTSTTDGASDAKASHDFNEQSSTYFTTATSSVTGESLTTVLEESSSVESSRELGGVEVLSPRATQFAPSVAKLEAGLEGHATFSGKPMFAEPDFGAAAGPVEPPATIDDTEPVVPLVLRRSPGSFSADTLKAGEAVSPTER
jgi:hypothetical protein